MVLVPNKADGDYFTLRIVKKTLRIFEDLDIMFSVMFGKAHDCSFQRYQERSERKDARNY